MQSLARKNEWPLDKMNLTVDVTKKFKEEFNQPAREGAYIYGLYMEGMSWCLTPFCQSVVHACNSGAWRCLTLLLNLGLLWVQSFIRDFDPKMTYSEYLLPLLSRLG